MKRSRIIFLQSIVCALICLSTWPCQAQETRPVASPSPTPRSAEQPEETIRIFSEEVYLPIFAYDDNGRFDPTLEMDDILVLEDGVPQQVRSVQRVPASILLLLCTSGEVNPAMRTNMTLDVSRNLVSNLRAGDRIAIMQFTSRTELIQDWTTDTPLIEKALASKVHSGRGTRLAPAITAAAAELQKQPAGNRHLVIIGDGVDVPPWANYSELMKAFSPDEEQSAGVALAQAIRDLIATEATVYVISYHALAQQIMEGKQKRRSSYGAGPPVSDGMRFDPAMRRLQKAYEKAMQKSEDRLTSLVEETGGRLLLPTSSEEMIAEGSAAARDIGSQYVVTYTPKRPLAAAPKAEYRHLTVASRR
ncbi:MAG TPA: VWA domain-containing protein, partial [Pyrinomonadaceae bacterium]